MSVIAGSWPAPCDQGVMFAAIDGHAAGLFAVADSVKETTATAIAALRADGIRIVMLTGDSRITAEAVAHLVGGVDEVIANVVPSEKGAVVMIVLVHEIV